MYRAMVELSTSPSLLDRIAACFATFQTPNPRVVAQENIWRLASTPGWADAWQYAVDAYSINQNPDTGARNDVITDEMIRNGVAAIHGAAAAAQTPPAQRRDLEAEGASLAAQPRPRPTLIERPGVPPGQVPSER